MKKPHVHKTHSAITKRLKRAQGHLRSVITMLEDQRECLEIAQQLHAVESAIASAKKVLIHDHIDHCLEHTVGGKAADSHHAIHEFKEITKYL